MTITCPCCRADNTASHCRRCKADLSLLLQTEQCRADLVVLAKAAIQSRQWNQAFRHLDEAELIRSDADIRQLKACLQLLQRDFKSAFDSYNALR